MQYCVYVTALQYGCVHVEAANEGEARKEVEKLFKQDSIPWYDGEITDIYPEEQRNMIIMENRGKEVLPCVF